MHSSFTRVVAVVFVLHVLAACWGLVNDPLVAAVGCGGAVVFAFAWYASVRRALFAFIVPLGFVWWNTFTLCYMSLAYVKLTQSPAVGEHDFTAWLTALMGVSATIGAIGVEALLGRQPDVRRPSPIVRSWQAFAVTGTIFVGIAVAMVATGLLEERWNANPDNHALGMGYIARGVSTLVYVFFFVSGTRIVRPILSPANLHIAVLVGVPALATMLTGSRGPTLFMVMLAVSGAAWAGLPRRQMIATGTIVAAVWMLFAAIVHDARGQSGFGEASAVDRVEIMSASAHTIHEDSSSEDTALVHLIGRMFESSAIIVVDQVRVTQRFAGFENFDRIKYLFVPAALAPDKRPLSDGRETLINEFGFDLGPLTSVPIMLVADSYRRGGEPWVIAIGILTGISLLLLSRWTLRFLGNDFGVVFIASFVIQEMSLPGESVLGVVSALSYYWLKNVLLFVGMKFMIKQLIAITTPGGIAAFSAAKLNS